VRFREGRRARVDDMVSLSSSKANSAIRTFGWRCVKWFMFIKRVCVFLWCDLFEMKSGTHILVTVMIVAKKFA